MRVDKRRDQKEPWHKPKLFAFHCESLEDFPGVFRGATNSCICENSLHPHLPITHLLLGCRLDWWGHKHLEVLSPRGPDPQHQPPHTHTAWAWVRIACLPGVSRSLDTGQACGEGLG